MSESRTGCMRLLLSALIWLQYLPISLAVKGDSGCRHSVCVAATVEGDVVTYEITAKLEPLGWVALEVPYNSSGFGSRMIHTHSVIMWKNEDGTTTLSQRYAGEYSEPQPVSEPPRVATVVEPKQSTLLSPHAMTFAFQIPANKSLLACSDPRESLVFAYSPVTPEKGPSSLLGRHQHAGYFTFDLTKESVAPPASAPKHKPALTIDQGTNTAYKRVEKLIVAHGFLLSFGFLVLLPAGTLVGRWGRVFTPRWFKVHWMFNMALSGPVIALGVLLGPVIVSSKESFRIHLANAHEICGMALFLIYCVQVSLGKYIHNRRVRLANLGPITHPHPPLNILHISLGVSIIALSFFQIRSGLEWWETLTGRGPITRWALPLWKAWIVILPLAYLGGYALLPRQLRQEREVAYAPVPVGAAEAQSHLLAEEE